MKATNWLFAGVEPSRNPRKDLAILHGCVALMAFAMAAISYGMWFWLTLFFAFGVRFAARARIEWQLLKARPPASVIELDAELIRANGHVYVRATDVAALLEARGDASRVVVELRAMDHA